VIAWPRRKRPNPKTRLLALEQRRRDQTAKANDMSTALICILMTLFAFEVREGLPPDDGTEFIRQVHLWAGFVAMGAIDALTIVLIRWHGKCYRRLTNPLTIVLGCSIINHAYGAFSYASGNLPALDVYDAGVNVIALAQALVFVWWWSGRKYGRRERRFHPRTPRINLHGRAVTLRTDQHKASHR